MSSQDTDVLIVGGGQAGIAMSEHLSAQGVPHLVLERARIGERWRSERWDSLVANGPAWHDRFPGREFSSCGPEEFPDKESVADYLVEVAAASAAPVRTGVEVTRVSKNLGGPGFRAETSAGEFTARSVVAATGPFQTPLIPGVIPASDPVTQVHSSGYKNPDQLPPGGVLVVGAGSSGVQIADELRRAGREVTLAVGPHDRPPRAYRSRDFVWWLGVLGKWDASAPPQGAEHVTIAVSGARGGHTVDFRDLAANGITLVGRAGAYADGVLSFDADLADNIRGGDENYLALLREADAYVERNGLDLPEEPEAHVLGPLPAEARTPIRSLNLAEAGITSVVWATGFGVDYGWLDLPALDERGRPLHQRGVSPEPGVYFLGLPWLSRRGSSFLWGVWHDAKYLADHIVTQRGYRAYAPEATVPTGAGRLSR
ncbi:flavin-containing monooxygenase [Leucobacter sp. M11]|uniref:flavin-containing monooxygenase n=1 Tax=Leucobacter sp. M11 TaxID=2993565 RepID=UPI002D80901D|nr:NAD(P)/FAD-dependent oxidoreductase [Leucobacter sp. M11]MEB4613342.1 NAD(P)/FAD-dependent oxidoreductase [Leucobacter sp. M11]